GAAGPLGGDDLRLDVEVGPGAQLSVRSVAASIALPGPGGAASRMHVRATVAAGAVLHWQPEPLIAAAGCNHDVFTEVLVAAGGAVAWRDDVVCGRHAEPPGDVRINTVIEYAGRALHRHELHLGPGAPGWAGAAVLGGARALGTVVIINPDWVDGGPPPAWVPAADAAVMPLTGPAVLATAVAPDSRAVAAALDPLSAPPTRVDHEVSGVGSPVLRH
ncbi:MAG TPA: urease accessory protein UreD, partial [Actinoplanes sp.]|nr:urease accessory protein UreD [Actinoplanes sp.]